mmetsp:Transcript_32622/g.105375  ORF Transcript_32622/g.105375 Transcript_32622/m.105375 type:complete len:350 (+) Transcript_32622:1392-2441(+)
MRSCTGQPISLPRRSNDSSKYSITMASSKPAATAASQRKASAAASPSPASMAAKPSVSGEGSGDGPVLLAPVPAAPLCPGITTGHPRVFGTDSCTYRKSGSNPAHFAPQPTGPSLSGRPLPTGIFSAAASRERSLACASASAAAAASSGGGAVAAMRSRSASWARVAAASEGGREKRQRVKAASNPERGTEALRQVHEKLKSRSHVWPWQAPPARARHLLHGTPVRIGRPNCSTAEVKRAGGHRTDVSRMPPGTEARYARSEGPSVAASGAAAGAGLPEPSRAWSLPLRRLATWSMHCESSARAAAEASRREAPPEASRIRRTKDEHAGASDDGAEPPAAAGASASVFI